MPTLYKFLTKADRGTVSDFPWPLPTRGADGAWQPGAWVEVAGKLVVCENAIHACRAEDCLNWLGPRLYTIAFRDDAYLLHSTDSTQSKVYGRAARLLAPVVTWNDRTARLFACDCAERVLPLYEDEYPRDTRPREAIAVARRYANGAATSDELTAAWAAAEAAARDAARDAARVVTGGAAWAITGAVTGDAAWVAAWAVTGDAARVVTGATERSWQTERFLAYINGEIH